MDLNNFSSGNNGTFEGEFKWTEILLKRWKTKNENKYSINKLNLCVDSVFKRK